MRVPADIEGKILAAAGAPQRVRLPGVPAKAPRRPARLAAPSLRLVVVVPLVTRSELNLRNWKDRSRRTKAAREAWRLAAWPLWGCYRDQLLPCVVTLTRLGGRALDDDNLRGALKACRDAVAEWLVCDDADPRIRWEYGQEPGGAYGVRVEIESVAGG